VGDVGAWGVKGRRGEGLMWSTVEGVEERERVVRVRIGSLEKRRGGRRGGGGTGDGAEGEVRAGG